MSLIVTEENEANDLLTGSLLATLAWVTGSLILVSNDQFLYTGAILFPLLHNVVSVVSLSYPDNAGSNAPQGQTDLHSM